MPVDLPVRKMLDQHTFVADASEPLMLMIVSICVVIALTGLIMLTPQSYRDGLSAAVYEGMLQAP